MIFSRLFKLSIDKGSLWNDLRLKRIAWFKKKLINKIEPHGQVRIIDIGGTPLFWDNMGMANDNLLMITCYNIKEITSQFKNISCFKGDATNLQDVGNDEYDIAFSNSVIEHVGSFAEQQKMASEVRRVAKNYFVQTPNFWFPIESHARLPFIQFLPLFLKTLLMLLILRKSIRDFKVVRSAVDNIRLLTKNELKVLFPDGSIIEERFLGMTKSFMAYKVHGNQG